MSTTCKVLLAYGMACVLLLGTMEPAAGSIVTFEIDGTLTEVYGPSGLAVGDPFTGTFSYATGQIGTNFPPIGSGEITRYLFESYTLTIKGQTVSATGGDIGIYNIPGFDHFKLNDTSAGTVTGSINGIPVSQLFLGLTDLTGNVFATTNLPTTLDLADFSGFRRIDIVFSDGTNGNGSAFGVISSLNAVPAPAGVWLFGSGIAAMAAMAGRRTKNSEA